MSADTGPLGAMVAQTNGQMDGDEFRAACCLIGCRTITSAATRLGVSERTVKRCRRGDVPATVRKLVEALMECRDLRARLLRAERKGE